MQPLHPKGSRSSRDVRKTSRRSSTSSVVNLVTLKQNDKDEKHDLKAAIVKINEDEYAMSAHAYLGGRWGDIEL